MDWQAMVLLGAYHGINPGMGWLFAVALGMQQAARAACGARCRRSRSATPPPSASSLLTAALAQARGPARRAESPRRVDADDARALPAVASSASAIRRHAGRLPRSDGLVVSDGVGARRRLHGAAVRDASTSDVCRPPAMTTRSTWRPQVRTCRGRRDRRRHSHAGVSRGDGAGRVGRVPQAGPAPSSHGVVQHGLAVGRRAGSRPAVVVLLK